MPLITIIDSKGSGMSLFSVISLFSEIQGTKINDKLRFYKGKYACKILHKGKKKALVMWLCSCDVVGNKELGYKSVSVFDIDIINYMRLLHYEYKG